MSTNIATILTALDDKIDGIEVGEGRNFTNNPILTSELADGAVTNAKIANQTIDYSKVVPYIFAKMINHTPEQYTMMDVFDNAMIKAMFGLKTIEMATDGSVNPENLKDLYVDIYSLISNSNNPDSYWAYLGYSEDQDIYGLFDLNDQVIHTFYDYGSSTWDGEYQFPSNLWQQMMIVDATSSAWTVDPFSIVDFESITLLESFSDPIDLWQAFQFTLEGLVSKVEIDQGAMNAGNIMTVNPHGFVVPLQLMAEHIFFDNLHGEYKLVADNVQHAIDEINRDLNYNALVEVNTTNRSMPPGMPRNYNFLVTFLYDMVDDAKVYRPLASAHQYKRPYFRDSALTDLAMYFIIDGKHVYYEYYEGGLLNTTVDQTDVSGNILLPEYHPITDRAFNWFMGANILDPFPETDTIQTIIFLNVQALYNFYGNPADLITTAKRYDLAINELQTNKLGQFHEEADEVSGLIYSANNPTIPVWWE